MEFQPLCVAQIPCDFINFTLIEMPMKTFEIGNKGVSIKLTQNRFVSQVGMTKFTLNPSVRHQYIQERHIRSTPLVPHAPALLTKDRQQIISSWGITWSTITKLRKFTCLFHRRSHVSSKMRQGS